MFGGMIGIFGIGGFAPAPEPPKQAAPNPPPAPGEWFCTACGAKNSGRFCTECGKVNGG